MAEQPIAHVIVPARNEALHIARSIAGIMADPSWPDFELTVACNGCTDSTADIARSFDGVNVIELAEGSKSAAINAAVASSETRPILVIDADVILGEAAISATVLALQQPHIHAAAPRIVLDTPADASWIVRRFTSAWRNAPYFQPGLVGAGFYGLDAEGADRAYPLPSISADDLYVQNSFNPTECDSSASTFSTTVAPTTRRLLKQEIRHERAKRQYRSWSRGNSVMAAERGGHSRFWVVQSGVTSGLVFTSVKLVCKLGALLTKEQDSWQPETR